MPFVLWDYFGFCLFFVCLVLLQFGENVQCISWGVLHGVPIELFLVPASASRLVYQRSWYVCGIVHIKKTLLLIGKSSPCGGSRFPLSLSVWYFTICLTPYNRK